jgi:hypothetical protein
LPGVVDQKSDLGLAAVQNLIRGDADSDAAVFSDQHHMMVAWHDKPLDLAIDRDPGRKES